MRLRSGMPENGTGIRRGGSLRRITIVIGGVIVIGGYIDVGRNQLGTGPIGIAQLPGILPVDASCTGRRETARIDIMFRPVNGTHAQVPSFANPASRSGRIVLTVDSLTAIAQGDRRGQATRSSRNVDGQLRGQPTRTQIHIEGIRLAKGADRDIALPGQRGARRIDEWSRHQRALCLIQLDRLRGWRSKGAGKSNICFHRCRFESLLW